MMSKDDTELSTILDNLCRFEYKRNVTRKRQFVKIGCTIGPKCDDIETMKKMIRAGMNIARFNMSHGTHEECAENIRKLHIAIEKNNRTSDVIEQIAIALDMSGPEIRTGHFPNNINEVQLNKGDIIKLTSLEAYEKRCSEDLIYVNYPKLPFIVKPNTKIFLDDGRITLRVNEIIADIIYCIVESNGSLSSNSAVHLHGIPIQLPLVSNKDRNDIKFAIEKDIDILIVSHVQNAEHIVKIKNYLGKKNSHIQVLAKINYLISNKSLDEIIDVSDGIIISREFSYIITPLEQSCRIQKLIIEKCRKASKPVLCCGQFLSSMSTIPYPTYSEISDVVNTILDDVDGIIVLMETSKGNFPVETVIELVNAAKEAEAFAWRRNILEKSTFKNISHLDLFQSTILTSVDISNLTNASAIICITKTGTTAILTSYCKPHCVIFAVTKYPRTAKKLVIHRSIFPLLLSESERKDWQKEINERVQVALSTGKKLGIIKSNDTVVTLSEWRKGTGFADTMRVIKVCFDGKNDNDSDTHPERENLRDKDKS